METHLNTNIYETYPNLNNFNLTEKHFIDKIIDDDLMECFICKVCKGVAINPVECTVCN